MEFITIDVSLRDSKGKGPARRLRRESRVPAILYGLGRQNRDLSISNDELDRLLKTGSRIVELKLGEKVQQALLRDIQYDPLTDAILHVDLVRVDPNAEIEAEVKVEFKGIAKGLSEGGVFEAILSHVLVRATPARLPKMILVDVTHLALNQATMVKDLQLPEGVKVLKHKPEDHVCHVVVQKVVSLEPATTEGAAEAAEPERIGGKKEEEPAGEEAAKGGAPAKAAPAAKKEEKEKKK
jgi:large subunit ribosomal protein L25